jgi:hypothetical protein
VFRVVCLVWVRRVVRRCEYANGVTNVANRAAINTGKMALSHLMLLLIIVSPFEAVFLV